MKTGTRNLIVVAVCIVVFGGVAAALLLTNNNNDENTLSSVSTATIELVSRKKEDVVSMAVKNQKGSYTLIPKVKLIGALGAVSGSNKDNITFKIKELKEIPVKITAAEQVVQNGFSLFATKNIGTVSSMDEFGLKNPKAEVDVTFKDGSTYNYNIGNVSPTDKSAYYMCGEKSNNVYIVSIDDGLLEGMNYFVDKDILFITNGAGENNFNKITLSGKNYKNPVTLKKENGELLITSPVNAPVSEAKLEIIKSALTNLTAESVEDVYPNAEKLKMYGLDNPLFTVNFNVNEKDYKLMVGKRKENNYYVMRSGINAVYLVNNENLNEIINSNAFDIRSKNILSPEILFVKSLAVKNESNTDMFAVTRKKDETKSTEDKIEYSYTVNLSGKNIDYETKYKNFYNEAAGIQLLEPTETKPTGTPALSLEYTYFDKNNKDVVEYYKSGERRYTAVLNGKVCGNVTSEDLEKIISQEKALKNS